MFKITEILVENIVFRLKVKFSLGKDAMGCMSKDNLTPHPHKPYPNIDTLAAYPIILSHLPLPLGREYQKK